MFKLLQKKVVVLGAAISRIYDVTETGC